MVKASKTSEGTVKKTQLKYHYFQINISEYSETFYKQTEHNKSEISVSRTGTVGNFLPTLLYVFFETFFNKKF